MVYLALSRIACMRPKGGCCPKFIKHQRQQRVNDDDTAKKADVSMHSSASSWRVGVLLCGASRALCAGAVPWKMQAPPRDSAEFAAKMPGWWQANSTLYEYFLPANPVEGDRDVTRHWAPQIDGCVHSDDCFCYHVQGSQDKRSNPRGAEQCEVLSDPAVKGKVGGGPAKRNAAFRLLKIGNCTLREQRRPCSTTCTVGRGKPCLHSLMGPAKLLSLMAIARAAGVTHIVEEGREGGLSAYMWWLHGFNVTSVEYLPQDEVGAL